MRELEGWANGYKVRLINTFARKLGHFNNMTICILLNKLKVLCNDAKYFLCCPPFSKRH